MLIGNIINNENKRRFLTKFKNKITLYILPLIILASAYISCNLNPIESPVERKETRLNFYLKADKNKYDLGEPLNLEYAVKNIGSYEAILKFNEPNKKLNYNIYQGNKFIYSDELSIDSLAQLITSSDSSSTFLNIKPDETVTFSGAWHQKELKNNKFRFVDGGNYNLIVKLDNLSDKILERNSELYSEFQIIRGNELVFNLKLNKDAYEVGEPVKLEYTIENVLNDTITLDYEESLDEQFNYLYCTP